MQCNGKQSASVPNLLSKVWSSRPYHIFESKNKSSTECIVFPSCFAAKLWHMHKRNAHEGVRRVEARTRISFARLLSPHKMCSYLWPQYLVFMLGTHASLCLEVVRFHGSVHIVEGHRRADRIRVSDGSVVDDFLITW